jgi:Leucine-rich repeat (LRR) protein
MQNNQLTGSIPSSIGSLTNLEYLYLYTNQLTGSIPYSIGSLLKLTGLGLYTNQLTGSIPSSIGSLLKLEELDLDTNQLTGSIPYSIGSLTNLEYFGLFTNQLTGSIPSSIGSLTNLEYLYLYTNLLTGSIPSSIGSLLKLEYLYLDTNQLTGSISSSIGSLLRLEELDLDTNQLTGSIPSSIGSLLKLEYLYLNTNQLTGSIPSSIGSLLRLQELNLNSNQLTGSISPSIGSLTKLEYLYLNSNQLTGSIPSSIGSLLKLEYLYLYTNQLTGSIPSSIGSLLKLLDLSITTNQLTGSIPSSIGSLLNLEYLFIFANQLTGSIPSSIGSLFNLEYLSIFTNQLTGSIPSSIGSLLKLQELNLNSNQLTGSIPSSIGSLAKLFYLYLYTNQLTGSIPSSIGSLTNLQYLYLDQIQPQVEPSNRKSSPLQVITISNNLFTGSFASLDFSFFSALTSLDAASNCFSGSISDKICAVSNSLQSLALGGAGANPEYHRNDDINHRLPFFMHGYFSPLGLEGSISSCIFGSEVLSTLQLSGNKLQGTIAELSSSSKSSTSSLNILQLSNNELTGTIPVSIQRHTFLQLDLPNNRLHGTLVDDFVVSSEQIILGLSVNRLSGPLPQSLKDPDISSFSNLSSLSILATNIFGCDSSEIPQRDPSAESYSCGSYEMDVACYVYVALAGATISAMTVLYMTLLKTKSGSGCLSSMMQKVKMTQSWYQSFQDLTMQHAFLSSSAPSTISSTTGSSFPDTIAFLFLIDLIAKWAKRHLLFSLVLLIPAFVAFSLSGSSILTFTYGYITSSTFLHGLGPVLFLILVLMLLFSIFVMAYRGLESLFELYRIRVDRSQAWAFGKQAYALVVLLHLVNLTVTVTVNSLYVSTLLSQNTLSQSQRLIVQILMGSFKLLWNGIYIPSAMQWLGRYMPSSSAMQNYMTMSLMNFVVAPCIATIASNQSCFYYVFVSQSNIPVPPVENCIFYEIVDHEYICLEYETFSSDLSLHPPFQYSYACGSALLVAYIPVLLYSYTIAGVALPCVRLLMLHYHDVIDEILDGSFLKALFWKPNRVQGRKLLTNYLIQIIVLMTFGLASPILSIVIVTCILSNVLLHQVLVGRIWQMDKQMVAAAAQARESDVEINPVHADNVKDATSSSSSYPRTCRFVNMLTLENLDMKDAWNSVFINGVVMVTTVSGFWAFIFFDMISDGYGLTIGLITSSLFALLFPSLVWAANRMTPSSWENMKAFEKTMMGSDGISPREESAAAAAAGMAVNQRISFVVEGEVGLQMQDIVHRTSEGDLDPRIRLHV